MGVPRDEIKAAMTTNDVAFPLVGKEARETQIPAGYEEDFICAYMKLAQLVSQEGPLQDHVAKHLEHLEQKLENN